MQRDCSCVVQNCTVLVARCRFKSTSLFRYFILCSRVPNLIVEMATLVGHILCDNIIFIDMIINT